MALLELSVSGMIIGILAVIFGILVLAFPKLLRYLVGFYFIILGVVSVIAAISAF